MNAILTKSQNNFGTYVKRIKSASKLTHPTPIYADEMKKQNLASKL